MHDELNQKISLFLDNELEQSEALGILQKMHSQPDLIDKMNRYEAISHVLKTNVFLYPDADFSAKINEQIQQEPFYLLPRGHLLSEHNRLFTRRNKWLALAASISVVAIISAQAFIGNGNNFNQSSAIQLAQQQTIESPSKSTVSQRRNDEEAPLNVRINDYLQAHNSSVYTNGEADFRPFAKVSANGRE